MVARVCVFVCVFCVFVRLAVVCLVARRLVITIRFVTRSSGKLNVLTTRRMKCRTRTQTAELHVVKRLDHFCLHVQSQTIAKQTFPQPSIFRPDQFGAANCCGCEDEHTNRFFSHSVDISVIEIQRLSFTVFGEGNYGGRVLFAVLPLRPDVLPSHYGLLCGGWCHMRYAMIVPHANYAAIMLYSNGNCGANYTPALVFPKCPNSY